MFGAPVFIAGGALAAALFGADARRGALAIALYFGGGGLGMVLSGATLPVLFARQGAAVWPASWLGLGAASLLCCAISLWAVRQLAPSRSGERPARAGG